MQTLIVEHKTTSEECGPGSVYWSVIAMDAQVSTYFCGARAIGHEVDGCLYDVLRKPAILPLTATPEADRKYTKPTKKDPVSRLYANQRDTDETPEEYRDRCMSAIAENPDRYYQRGIVVRLESDRRDAAFDLWQTADQIRLAQNADRWPRNVESCRTYNRLCDFFPVCSGTATEADARYEVVAAHVELEGKTRLPMLTTSSARCFRTCPRRYQFRHVKGLRAKTTATTLAFGTKVHKGLEAWLPAHDLDAALAVMRAPETPYGFDDAKAEAMLRGYDARWSGEDLEVVAVEAQFVTDLRRPETGAASRTFCLAGKIDAIVRKP